MQVKNETEGDDMDQDTRDPRNRITMNRNVRHEPKMNRVQVNHPIIDSKIESEYVEKVQEINFQTLSRTSRQRFDSCILDAYCLEVTFWGSQF